MKRLLMVSMLGAFAFSTGGCALLAVGAGGAYVYGQHEENKEKKRAATKKRYRQDRYRRQPPPD